MKTAKNICLIDVHSILFSCKKKELNLNVLQFNVWQEGTIIEDGF